MARRTHEPTYAPQMATPFAAALKRFPQVPEALVAAIEDAPEGVRLPVAAGQEFLAQMVELTGEPDLGLLAAQTIELGNFEVLEFAAYSAPTWRAALETTLRYIHLMNEAADFRLEIEDGQAHVVLDSTVPLTRAGIDFQAAAFHVSATRWFSPVPTDLQVWFTYPQPEDISAHRATFGRDVTLRFSAPWNGFVHDASVFERSITGADPSVHRVLRDHAERLLAELAPGDGLAEQVRAQLLSSLTDGPPSAAAVAKQLGISRRTLTRRLGQQGTSFTELLDDVRQHAATHYLTDSDHSIDDIAFLLGFSEASAFVRAFRRWHGQTPLAYRRAQRS